MLGGRRKERGWGNRVLAKEPGQIQLLRGRGRGLSSRSGGGNVAGGAEKAEGTFVTYHTPWSGANHSTPLPPPAGAMGEQATACHVLVCGARQSR